jgi:hypothetical protein
MVLLLLSSAIGAVYAMFGVNTIRQDRTDCGGAWAGCQGGTKGRYEREPVDPLTCAELCGNLTDTSGTRRWEGPVTFMADGRGITLVPDTEHY